MIPDNEIEHDPLDGPGDRRDPAKGRKGDRRRVGWRDFRRAYPGFVFTLIIALIADMLNRLRINQDKLLYELKKSRYGRRRAEAGTDRSR